MERSIQQNIRQSNEKFSIGSLIYARLRRATSRVIDVMYLSENDDYALYVISLALATHDDELHRLASRLQSLVSVEEPIIKATNNSTIRNTQSSDEYLSAEPTQEDIYREQVSHHYIGSLR